MSKRAKYLFVSVPSSITPSGHKDDAIQSLQSAVKENYGSVNALNIPEFKVGTLDALLQQSEELARLEGLCQGVVSKVGDTLKNILDGDEQKMAQHKAVNDSMLCSVPYGQSSLQDLTSAQNRWTNTSNHSLGIKSSTGQTSLSQSY
jgi:hypothetical protein